MNTMDCMTADNLAGRLRDLAAGPVDARLADLLREIADGVSTLSEQHTTKRNADMRISGTGYEEAEEANRE